MATKTAPIRKPNPKNELELKPVAVKGCSLDRMRELTREWASQLNIIGWRIRVRFAHPGELPEATVGTAYIQYKAKTASLRILPSHLWATHAEPEPIEQIIIHELLHIHFHSSDDDDKNKASAEQEQSIELLAWAFFRFKYPGWNDAWANVTQL